MKIIKGNLLDLADQGEFDIIVHGCNCYNTMGSGIARQIRERYPEAWMADQATLEGDINKLGTISIAQDPSGRFMIVNAYTQYGFNRKDSPTEDVFEYTAFQLILEKMIKRVPNNRFGFPMIGMGLAGGNKERILAMLEDFSQKVELEGGSVTLVEFDS